VFCAFFIFSNSSAQHTTKCAATEQQEWLFEKFPELQKAIEEEQHRLEDFTKNFTENRRNQRTPLYVIPVVFHVIHMNGEENISDQQVFDAVRVINEDFNAENEDLNEIVTPFQSIIGDGEIEFRLAKLDPSGNATNGIDRIQSNETFTGDDDSKLNHWPRENYLNIWVCENITSGSGNNAAAYAYLPSAAQFIPDRDGIISNHRYIGAIGTANQQRSHTLSHEIGHFLNLFHPWGSTNNAQLPSNCNQDDGVSDTPNTEGTLGGCNLTKNSCGSLDNVQNLMDYASCDRMFTKGQVARMHAALNSTTADRRNLWQQSNLDQTGVGSLVEANFSIAKPYTCEGGTVQFFDASQYGATSWNWTFLGANSTTSNQENPLITYDTPGIYSVSLQSSDGANSVNANKSNVVLVNPLSGRFAPYEQNFQSVNQIPYIEWMNINPYNDFYSFRLDPTSGFDNDRCILLNNFGNQYQTEDVLVSTTFDLTNLTEGTFSFKYAFAQRDATSTDKLSFFLSTDCGETWLLRWEEQGGNLATTGIENQSWIPSSTTEWATQQIPLRGSSISENTMFRFVFQSDGGNNLFIDDINISGDFSDIALLQYPEDNSTNVMDTVVLQWKPSGDIDAYEYQLDTSSTFNSPLLETDIKSWISSDPNNSDTEYRTNGLILGQQYFWRVRLIKNGSPLAWSVTWDFTVSNFPSGLKHVDQNMVNAKIYPNPAYQNTTLAFELDQASECLVEVFDLYGKQVFTEHTFKSAGEQRIVLNTLNYAKGMYAVKLSTKQGVHTAQLIVK